MLGPGWVRFVLAWMVVVEHVSRFQIGKVAVMAFFILSGYWVSRVFVERYAQSVQGITLFYVARGLRIWPLYVMIFFCMVLAAFFFPLDLPPDFWRAVLIFGVASHDVDLIGVTWSLDIELQFYLLVPVIVLLLQAFKHQPYQMPLLVGLSVLWVTGLLLGSWYGLETVLIYLPLFLTGAVLFVYDIRASRQMALLSLGAFCLLGVIVVASPALRPYVIYGSEVQFIDQIFALLWALLLAPFIAHNVTQPSGILDYHVGQMSYVVYLVHFPLVTLTKLLLGRAMVDAEKSLFFVVVLLVSWLVYFAVDVHLAKARKSVLRALRRGLALPEATP